MIPFKKILSVLIFFILTSCSSIPKVSNFDRYAEFIPGCSSSHLIERRHPIEIGRLEFQILGKDYSIESENTLTENSIIINQISGPFDHLGSVLHHSKSSGLPCVTDKKRVEFIWKR